MKNNNTFYTFTIMNTNIDNLIDSFKQVFISTKNTGYLFDLIVSKTLKNNPEFQPVLFKYINAYKDNMLYLRTYFQ